MKTFLVWVAFESILPESLLDDLPFRIQTALLLDPKDGAHLSKLPLIQDDVILRICPRHLLAVC